MNKLIAFTGKKQSGKSTACAYLEEVMGITKRINFKSALLEEVEQNFPNLIKAMIEVMEKLNYDGNNPWTFERLINEKPPLMRGLLQNYGTEVRRRDKTDYWVDKWKLSVQQAECDVLTDDCRFENEAQAIRDVGGIIIRIIREDMVETGDAHKSEQEMNNIVPDYTISVMTGEHERLYRELDRILENITISTVTLEEVE